MSDIDRSGEGGRVVIGRWLLGPSMCGHDVGGVIARGVGGLVVCRRRFLIRGEVGGADVACPGVARCRFCSAVNEGAGTSGGGGVSIGCGRSG